MASPKSLARLEAVIQRRAAHCLQFEVTDPRAGFVTITGVELSKDMAVAKISYSVLGDDSMRSKVAHLLEHATGFIQRQVAGILRVRRAPQLRFIYDESIAEASRIDQLIREARRRDDEISGASSSTEADAGTEESGESGLDAGDESSATP